MQMRYSWSKRRWESRYNQAGAKDGWSEWDALDRQDALARIEQGQTFTYCE